MRDAYDENERDDDNVREEKYMSDDISPLLMVQWFYLALKGTDDEWL